MKNEYYFPFGEKLKKVEQCDKSAKKAFVLGVYASAVHAKWIGEDGKQKVSALAVASEPEIFWTGNNAENIINSITIPSGLGKLVPAREDLNGPSGRALDELFLSPLGLDRDSVWLCDLLPYSRVNESQRRALDKQYTDEVISKFNLKPATIPDFDKSELDSETRRKEILNELEQSQAKKIILLGDLPICKFLHYFDNAYSKLSQFGETSETYGLEHKVMINGLEYVVIPLCHPRQAAKLGNSNSKWKELHDGWVNRMKTNNESK